MAEQWAVTLVWRRPGPRRLTCPTLKPTARLQHPQIAIPRDGTDQRRREQSLWAISPVPVVDLSRHGYPALRLMPAHREHRTGWVCWRLTNLCAFDFPLAIAGRSPWLPIWQTVTGLRSEADAMQGISTVA